MLSLIIRVHGLQIRHSVELHKDMIHSLSEFIFSHVHELDDEVALVQEEVVFD